MRNHFIQLEDFQSYIIDSTLKIDSSLIYIHYSRNNTRYIENSLDHRIVRICHNRCHNHFYIFYIWKTNHCIESSLDHHISHSVHNRRHNLLYILCRLKTNHHTDSSLDHHISHSVHNRRHNLLYSLYNCNSLDNRRNFSPHMQH